MQKKEFNFTLPRTITRDQWRIIHSDARRMIYNQKKLGGDYAPVFTRIAEKYGATFYHTLRRFECSFFWDITSHFKYDRSFIKTAISCNSKGRMSDRRHGVSLAMKDPNHPAAAFINAEGKVA